MTDIAWLISQVFGWFQDIYEGEKIRKKKVFIYLLIVYQDGLREDWRKGMRERKEGEGEAVITLFVLEVRLTGAVVEWKEKKKRKINEEQE